MYIPPIPHHLWSTKHHPTFCSKPNQRLTDCNQILITDCDCKAMLIAASFVVGRIIHKLMIIQALDLHIPCKRSIFKRKWIAAKIVELCC